MRGKNGRPEICLWRERERERGGGRNKYRECMDNGLTDLAFKTAAMETKRSKKREALGMETGSINEQDREREGERFNGRV